MKKANRELLHAILEARSCIASAKELDISDSAMITKISLRLSYSLLEISKLAQTSKERRESRLIAKLLPNPQIKSLLLVLADRLFRTKNSIKTKKLLFEKKALFTSVSGLTIWEKLVSKSALLFLSLFPLLAVPWLRHYVRSKMKRVLFEKEDPAFFEFISKADQEGFIITVNRLGESILGEEEAEKRFQNSLEDLLNPLIKGISIKLSSLFSTISSLGFQDNILPHMKERMLFLLKTTKKMDHMPLITIDMEEYRDLYVTQELVCDIAQNPEVHDVRFGVAIQAYIPDSYAVVKRLISISKQRVETGGKPIYIRLVKGANLLVEQFEAHIRNWPQVTFATKQETDASYTLLMKLLFSEIGPCIKSESQSKNQSKSQSGSIEVGIATHNIFDMAYGLVLAHAYGVQDHVWYEMLAGMAPQVTRAMKEIAEHHLMLYCPVAEKEEITSTISYLIRRLDENIEKEHFLPALAEALVQKTGKWRQESEKFVKSIEEQVSVSHLPHKTAYSIPSQLAIIENITNTPLFNCPDIDWTYLENRKMGEEIARDWQRKEMRSIPLVVDGKEIESQLKTTREDPSRPGRAILTYSLANDTIIRTSIEHMSQFQTGRSRIESWSQKDRISFLLTLAKKIEERRFQFIGAMLQEVSKPIPEGDSEVSEAIDFCRYYASLLIQEGSIYSWKQDAHIAFVAAPWNFPLSLSLQHILQALLSGYAVIYKPSLEAVGVGSLLVETILETGIHPALISFLPMQDNPEGLSILQHPQVNALFLTGSTNTGRLFLKEGKNKRIYAETGGKNVAYLSSASDVDLALRDIVRSAFSFSGQKCSALSVLLVDRELFESSSFLSRLKDAAKSLITDSAWNLSSTVVPLATAPSNRFLQAAHNLESGEEWLLPLRISDWNSRLYYPSIKILKSPGTFSHMNELFGPLLSLIPVYDVHDAVRIAHMTPFGLTSGIYSLSDEEIKIWQHRIQTGMVYINRPTVGALVGRQPFGGWRASSFGIGMKVGGPFSLRQLMTSTQGTPYNTIDIPMKGPILSLISSLMSNEGTSSDACSSFIASSRHIYTIWETEFAISPKICSSIAGQTNELFIVPREEIIFYIQDNATPHMVWAFISMAIIASTRLHISRTVLQILAPFINEQLFLSCIKRQKWNIFDSHEEMVGICKTSPRIKALKPLPKSLYDAVSEYAFAIDEDPLSMNPKIDFLHFFHEKSVSHDTHRYGTVPLKGE